MPVLGALGGLLLSLVAGFVGRTLAALGIAFVTYYGVSEGLEFLKQLVSSNLHALPPNVIAVLGLMKIGQGLTILFSCMFANMLLNGFTQGGTLKKMIFG